MNYTMKLSKKLSFGEEIANSVTHAVGALLMLIFLPITKIEVPKALSRPCCSKL